jgi:sarcosine oxidase subunit gamma
MADGRARGTLEAYARRMQSAGAAGTRLAEQPFPAQVGLRVAPGSDAARRVEAALGVSLPVTPNTVARAGERTVLWLGPDEWLVVEPAEAEAETEPALREALGGEGAVVDLSANRTVLILAGPDAREVLASCCPLDLHPSVFRPGSCAQTLLAKAQVIVEAGAVDADGTPREYALYVRPSFAAYVAEWLLDGIQGLRENRRT